MNFLSKLFKTKNKKLDSSKFANKLAFLEIDMHNHLLPGIDDGSKTAEESLSLITGMQDLGLNRFICTPHIMQGVHENTKGTIQTSHHNLTEFLKQNNNSALIYGAAEHMIDENLNTLVQQNNLCVMPGNYVLIEMSYLAESKALFQTIYDIQNLGYKPILAHPERYNYYHLDFEQYKKIKNTGCLFQLNLLSISRYYGTHVKSTALTLLKSGMYDLVGSDVHHTKHLNALQEVAAKYPLESMLKSCTIQNKVLAEEFDNYFTTV